MQDRIKRLQHHLRSIKFLTDQVEPYLKDAIHKMPPGTGAAEVHRILSRVCTYCSQRWDLAPQLCIWKLSQQVAFFGDEALTRIESTDPRTPLETATFTQLLWQPTFFPFAAPCSFAFFADDEMPRDFFGAMACAAAALKGSDEPALRLEIIFFALDGETIAPAHCKFANFGKTCTIEDLAQDAAAHNEELFAPVSGVLQRLRFLCSEEAEAEAWRRRAASEWPTPVKTKRGMQLFAPLSPKVSVFQ